MEGQPGRGRWDRRIELFHKTMMTVYATVVAWQTLKIVCPGLQVREDEVVALVKHHLKRWAGRRPEVPPPHDWVRDLMDDLRRPPDAD